MTAVSLQGTMPDTRVSTRLKTSVWALASGAVSGLASVVVRLMFRLLQWIFLHNAGLIVGLRTLLSAVTHAPFMAVKLTGQYHLLPWLVSLNLLAWLVARRLSPHALYAISTPEPLSS